ncbi:serine hydrolase [Nonomuraea sp. NPDC050328]|uniref:serine hydrolase n=1 Tax=Nonomuraea sp. NPDC050328 TaxID=3364361 RepID=UPI0037AEAED7
MLDRKIRGSGAPDDLGGVRVAALGEVGEWLKRRLPELLGEHDVPGAVVAIGIGDEVVEAAAGLLSRTTGVGVTTDSIFQIGSVTKVLTATLVMQFVDEGKVELDAPAGRYVPEFGREGTVRQLLCHVAGFEGDIFTDTGKGDDCLAKFVALLDEVPQVFGPGEMFSYNNAGFCVLGRLVESVRGRPFDECLREHLFGPLGMTHAANDPYEAVLHRVAVGHIAGEPTPVWALARSNAPAGSMLAMRARDLLAFGRMHLAGGVAADGARVLSRAGVEAMREVQVRQPDLWQGEAWGLGWELFESSADRAVFGHDGNTIGQSAFLRVVPELDLVLVVLTNGGSPKLIFREIFGRFHDLPEAPVPDPQARPTRPERYAGVYESSTGRTTVSVDGEGRVWLDRVPLGVTAELDEVPYRSELVAWRGDSLIPLEPEGGAHAPVAFLGDDGEGRALYLHTGRADRRSVRPHGQARD